MPVDEAYTSGGTGSIFLVGVNVLSETPRLGLVDLHLSVNREHPSRDKKDGAPNDTVVDPSEHKGKCAPFAGNVGVVQTISWVGGIPTQPSRRVVERKGKSGDAHGPPNNQWHSMKVGLNFLHSGLRPTIPYDEDVVHAQHAVVHRRRNVAGLVEESLRGTRAGRSDRGVNSWRSLRYWPSGHDIDYRCHDVKCRKGQDEPIVRFGPPALGSCHILENVG